MTRRSRGPGAPARWLVGCICFQMVACDQTSQEETHAAKSTIRDSVGVLVVENHRPRSDSSVFLRVDPDPSVQIPSAAESRSGALTQIGDIVLLSTGGLLAVEGSSGEIRHFGPDGQHIRTFGGRGEGPGEFPTYPDLAVLPGDTILALDFLGQRMAWFTLEGELVRTTRIELDALARHFAGVMWPERRVLLPDKSLIYAAGYPRSVGYRPGPGGTMIAEAGEMGEHDLRLGYVSFTDGAGSVLGRFPGSERGYVYSETPAGPRSFFVTNPLYPPLLYTAEVGPARIHVASPGAREFRTFGPDGRLIRIVRQSMPLTPLTSARVTSVTESLIREGRERGVPTRLVRDLLRRMAVPDSLFPFSEMHGDPLGRIWLREYDPWDEGSARTYHVFDSAGVWLGSAEIPVDVGNVRIIGRESVVTVVTDEFDVPTIRLYRLMEP